MLVCLSLYLWTLATNTSREIVMAGRYIMSREELEVRHSACYFITLLQEQCELCHVEGLLLYPDGLYRDVDS